MTGYDAFNFPAFDAARDSLRELGYDVTSPADIDRSLGLDPLLGRTPPNWDNPDVQQATIRGMMREDLRIISQVDFVYFLRGWEKSRGARAEYTTAVFYRDMCGGKPQLMFEKGAVEGLDYVPSRPT
jgi:hypothetical protein